MVHATKSIYTQSHMIDHMYNHIKLARISLYQTNVKRTVEQTGACTVAGGKGMADSQGTQLASVETLLEMPGCVPNALLAAVPFSSSSNVVSSPACFWPLFCNGPKGGLGTRLVRLAVMRLPCLLVSHHQKRGPYQIIEPTIT